MDQQCFRKTAKGIKEIEERSGFLSQIARRLLITMDGKKTRGELLKAFSLPDFEEALAKLELLKMVEEVSPPAAVPTSKLLDIDKHALSQVRNIMHMSNQQYLAGKLDRFLAEDFNKIHSKAELEPVLEHWHRLLCDEGHSVTAYAHLRQIKATLGWG
jgi:hypothetical protein